MTVVKCSDYLASICQQFLVFLGVYGFFYVYLSVGGVWCHVFLCVWVISLNVGYSLDSLC